MLQKRSVAMLMLNVLTSKDRTTALAKLVIREMGKRVKVKFVVLCQDDPNGYICALKGLGHAILGSFSTDQMVIELTKI